MVDVLLEYIEKLQRNTGHHIGLSTEEVDALAATMEVRHYNKKEKLIDINQKEQYLHFVVRGLVRKFFYKGKQEIVTQLSKEGDLVSSTVSFFSELPSEYVNYCGKEPRTSPRALAGSNGVPAAREVRPAPHQ